jgi:aminopeptidase N
MPAYLMKSGPDKARTPIGPVMVPAFVLLLATAVPTASPAADLMHHSIAISIYPPDNSLLATDTVYVAGTHLNGGKIVFLINRSLEIEDIQSPRGARWYSQEEVEPGVLKQDPDEDDLEFIERGKGVFIEITDPTAGDEMIPIAISYSGVLYDSLLPPDRNYSRGFATTTGLIDERGTYLANESLWYPFQFDASFTFRLTVDLPPDWMCVSQGRLAEEYLDEIRDEERLVEVWVETNPTPEFYLVAGNYYRHQESLDGKRIMAYTYDTSDSLAQVYLDATRRYIAMYEDLIGEYPHPKFAMVENFWQTGYGMPSFTLLGDRVIRLPFIVHTSYGHEILHNWWGNCVFVDYDSGNWCEGLTTYGADYLYKERQSADAARQYRHQTLITFNNYVTDENDFPLSAFHERHDTASQSVGYGKSLLIFHMLRQQMGDEAFWRSLREFYYSHRYRVASWKDLEEAFTQTSGEDLAWYFDQWVNRTGLPEISLEAARAERRGSRHAAVFTLRQGELPFTLDVPVVVTYGTGNIETTVRLAGVEKTFSVESDTMPLSLAVDPDFNMFRKLYTEEIPMTISGAFASDTGTIIIGNHEELRIRHFLSGISRSIGVEGEIMDEAVAGAADLTGSHLWFLGRGDALSGILSGTDLALAGDRATIAGSEFDIAGRTLVCTLRNPRDGAWVIAVVISEDMKSLAPVVRKLPHYGGDSYLIFEGEKVVERGVWEAKDSPLRADFAPR